MRRTVVAVLALVLTACGSVLPTSSATPSATLTAAPPSSSTAPTPSPTPVPPEATWTQVTLTNVPSASFGATKDDQIVASTAWPGGFLFIGETFSGEPPTELVWRSTSGSTWTRTVVPAFAGTDVRGITWTGQRLVVIATTHPISGITAPRPPLGFAWTSTDGTTWTPVSDPQGSLAHMVPTSIGSGPAGVVIAGNRPYGGLSLLHSSDGVAWSADDTTTSAFSGVQYGGAVVGWTEGFLLTTSVPAVITPPVVWAPPTAAAFGSADGITWAKASVPEGAESLSFVTAGDQIVAVGDTCVACIGAFASWSTADHGATWQQEAQPSQGLSLGTMITSTGTRFVDISAGRLRWSDDGRTWHPLVSSGPAISPDYSFQLLVSGDRVVLVGWQGISQGSPNPNPLVLVGQLR